MMFIGTHNIEIANKLKAQGYPVVKEFMANNNKVYLFKNINKISFENSDKRNIFYTNKMMF